MQVRSDTWTTDTDGRTQVRVIRSATLNEVSFVARPANPQAQVLSVRHEVRSADGGLIEYRAVGPVTLRDESGDQPDAFDTCPECDGSGKSADGVIGGCWMCNGSGVIDDDDPDPVNARRLGLMATIPDSWDPSTGGLKRSATPLKTRRGAAELELELALIEAGESRLARAHRGVTPRDRAEDDWRRHRASQEAVRGYLEQRWMPRGS